MTWLPPYGSQKPLFLEWLLGGVREWGYVRYKVKSCVLNYDTDTREITDALKFHRQKFIY